MAAVPPAGTPGTESTPAANTPSAASVFLAVLSSVSPKRTSNRPFATGSLSPSTPSSGESVAEFFALKEPPPATGLGASRMPLKLSMAGGGVSPPPRPTTSKVADPNPDPAAWARA